MQQLTDLSAAQRIDDRPLYAPLREALNAEREPYHLPHMAQDWPGEGGVWSFKSTAPKACNQNCNQGRACDCVPAIVDDEPAHMGEGGGVFLWPAGVALALFALLLSVHYWRA